VRRSTVLLVDWPSQQVPRTLAASGFAVLSANFVAGTASSYSLGVPGETPAERHDTELLAPDHPGDAPLLISRLDAMPEHVDAVALYRPPEEHAAITQRAVALGATVLWVQRGSLSDDARQIAAVAGVSIVEDLSLTDALRALARDA
jgi:hypothetical protein